MEFKKQQEIAMQGSVKVIVNANSQFKKIFKRSYGDGLIETYNMQGAKTALIGMGTLCSTARVVIDELRKKGQKVGLIKLKSYRPFPVKELRKVAKNLKTLAVVDRDVSFGYEGALAIDVKAALRDMKISINSYIAGLGGRDIRPEDILHMITAKDRVAEWINTQ
jgi:pyruvate ferredoxin oxidoreductase alpha subunit